jgi:tetratricopeptide (TPR) repeat protein
MLAKCVLIINQLKSSSPPEAITFEKLVNTNLKEIKPWWLYEIFPPMFIIISENDVRIPNPQISIFTHRNIIFNHHDKEYLGKTIYSGEVSKFDLHKIMDTSFPKLENRNDWIAAIEFYAKGLELEIKVVNSGLGSRASEYGCTEFGEKVFNCSSYYAIQNRARTTAYLKYGVMIYEHYEYVQIRDISELDALLNLKNANLYIPSITEEMADLHKYYSYLTDLHKQGTITFGDSTYNPSLAELKYEELLKSIPNFVAARVNLANVLLHNEKLDKALEQIKIAIDLAPEDPDVWETAGRIHHGMGNIDNAIKCYFYALEMSPSDFVINFNLGYYHRVKKDYQNSIKWYFKALEKLDPSSQSYWKDRYDTLLSLAIGFMKISDFQSEIKAIDACLEIVPNETFLLKMRMSAENNVPIIGLN